MQWICRRTFVPTSSRDTECSGIVPNDGLNYQATPKREGMRAESKLVEGVRCHLVESRQGHNNTCHKTPCFPYIKNLEDAGQNVLPPWEIHVVRCTMDSREMRD